MWTPSAILVIVLIIYYLNRKIEETTSGVIETNFSEMMRENDVIQIEEYIPGEFIWPNTTIWGTYEGMNVKAVSLNSNLIIDKLCDRKVECIHQLEEDITIVENIWNGGVSITSRDIGNVDCQVFIYGYIVINYAMNELFMQFIEIKHDYRNITFTHYDQRSINLKKGSVASLRLVVMCGCKNEPKNRQNITVTMKTRMKGLLLE